MQCAVIKIILQSKELNGLVSQPLLDGSTKSTTARYNSSPSFLTSGEYPVASTNGTELNHQPHNGAIENERRLWADEKESLQKQIQVITIFCIKKIILTIDIQLNLICYHYMLITVNRHTQRR